GAAGEIAVQPRGLDPPVPAAVVVEQVDGGAQVRHLGGVTDVVTLVGERLSGVAGRHVHVGNWGVLAGPLLGSQWWEERAQGGGEAAGEERLHTRAQQQVDGAPVATADR